MNTLLDALGYFGFIFFELVVLFLSISTIVSLVLQYIPKERLNSYLSKKGPTGYLLAALLGSITPFCACSTIPLTLGLLNAGVAIGPIITFVLISPLLNPIIVAMVWTLIGWKACLIYFVVCFFTALVGGWLMSVLHAERFVRKFINKSNGCCCSGEEAVPTSLKGKFKKAFKTAYDDLQGVLIYLIIGTAIGAFIYGYIPQEWILSIAGKGNIFAVPVAALVGIPLYIRAESAIPIGLALAQKGMSLGAVIALIIGGAGMAIPEMSMLLSIFKARIVGAIVALVFLTAVIGGYAFDRFLS